MQISAIIAHLESLAPPALQESYDNCGLLAGSADWECTGILTTLDTTEEVVNEAAVRGCNLIVAHHPIIFGGLKKISDKNYVGKAVITAIKKDIALYAIHTNLDNIGIKGVNGRIAEQLGILGGQPLWPASASAALPFALSATATSPSPTAFAFSSPAALLKLYCFVPLTHLAAVRTAIFEAGAGHIGGYSECSWSVEGTGTFKGGDSTQPFLGQPGIRHEEKEARLEAILPVWLSRQVVHAMIAAHPYEEVAYDLVPLANTYPGIGSGLLGELPEAMDENDFLARIKSAFGLAVIRHTRLTGRPVKRVAICGGAGSFLISKALSVGANFYITSDVKYHEFFDANDRMVIADIGHFESEQFTIDLLFEVLREKFSNFAILKSETRTNPVYYY